MTEELYRLETVKEWEDLIKFFKDHSEGQWMFRGQESFNLDLQTTLERALCTVAALKEEENWKKDVDIRRKILNRKFNDCSVPDLEKRLLREFMRKSHQYLGATPNYDHLLEWVALMQHYGAPTRLLDWTYSFFVAVYFAVEKAADDCAVYAINADWLEKILKKESPELKAYEDKEDKDITYNAKLDPENKENYFRNIIINPKKPLIHQINPYRLNERLIIQQGLFLLPEDISKPFEDNLTETFSLYRSEYRFNYIKYKIEHHLRTEILQKLHRMNINRASLFPGLDGFSSSLSITHILLHKCNNKY